jgi:hypothetical protein
MCGTYQTHKEKVLQEKGEGTERLRIGRRVVENKQIKLLI